MTVKRVSYLIVRWVTPIALTFLTMWKHWHLSCLYAAEVTMIAASIVLPLYGGAYALTKSLFNGDQKPPSPPTEAGSTLFHWDHF